MRRNPAPAESPKSFPESPDGGEGGRVLFSLLQPEKCLPKKSYGEVIGLFPGEQTGKE